jgi:hypothetical protein
VKARQTDYDDRLEYLRVRSKDNNVYTTLKAECYQGSGEIGNQCQTHDLRACSLDTNQVNVGSDGQVDIELHHPPEVGYCPYSNGGSNWYMWVEVTISDCVPVIRGYTLGGSNSAYPGYGCLAGANDVNGAGDETLGECRVLCDADSQCKSFDFYAGRTGHTCQLSHSNFASVGSTTSTTDCRYYEKHNDLAPKLGSTMFTGASINNGTPLPIIVRLDLGNNEWIVGVEDHYMKMVKIRITGRNQFTWLGTRYDYPFNAHCNDPSTFALDCWSGPGAVNPGSNTYPVSLVTENAGTQVVYKSGTTGNSVDETITGTLSGLVPGHTYSIDADVLRNDLGQSSEYVKSINVGGHDMGACHPDGGDYDCTFFRCPLSSAKVTASATGTIDVTMIFTGHSRDCDCNTATWECSKESTNAAHPTPMKAVARFHYVATGMVVNPPQSARSFSGVWDNKGKGDTCNKSLLGTDASFGAAWCAGSNTVGQWMQMDLGSVKGVAGIVTQKRGDGGTQYVTSVKVKVSENGSTWSDIDGGKSFSTNISSDDVHYERHTEFAAAAQARYVRIYPQSWSSHMSMRAGVIIN